VKHKRPKLEEGALRVFAGLAVFAVLGRIAQVRLGLEPPSALPPTVGVAMILAGVLALLASVRPAGWRVAAALGLGAVAEVVGVVTGAVFGPYTYTHRWAPVVALPGGELFPLLVPWAWLLVAGGCAWALPLRGWARSLAAGLVAALIDLPMEAVMTEVLRYWEWNPRGPLPGGAPWQNFFAWWAVASAAATLLPEPPSTLAQLTALRVLSIYGAFLAAVWLIGPAR
jgi:putative membrane protein